MKINALTFSLGASISIAICYSICAFFCLYWPAICLKLTADLFHLKNLDMVAPVLEVTLTNFISGLVQSVVYTYVVVFIWAAIYNLFEK